MNFYDVNSMSSTLQEVAVRVIGNEQCKTYPDYADKLEDTMICAGYKVSLLLNLLIYLGCPSSISTNRNNVWIVLKFFGG